LEDLARDSLSFELALTTQAKKVTEDALLDLEGEETELLESSELIFESLLLGLVRREAAFQLQLEADARAICSGLLESGL